LFPLKDNIPTERFPVITVVLIAINVAVFLFWQEPSGFGKVNNQKVVDYGAVAYEVTHPGKECALASAVDEAGTAVEGGGGEGQVVCEGRRPQIQTPQGAVEAGPTVERVPGDHPPAWLTLFTSMFMHGGFLHIIGNMLFLWIFGNNVEDSMGRVKFVLFYLLGGLAADALQILPDANSTTPLIGASGAVAGVLGGYIVMYPRAKVLTLIFIVIFFTLIELPAFLVLGFWFLQQIFFAGLGLSDPVGDQGGVAYFAHVGGFAFGLIAIKAFATRRKDYDPEPRIPVY
jgi:rhomboid family protein